MTVIVNSSHYIEIRYMHSGIKARQNSSFIRSTPDSKLGDSDDGIRVYTLSTSTIELPLVATISYMSSPSSVAAIDADIWSLPCAL